MTRKQIYLLIGMGVVMLLVLTGVIVIYTARDLEQKRVDYQSELNSLKDQSNIQITETP